MSRMKSRFQGWSLALFMVIAGALPVMANAEVIAEPPTATVMAMDAVFVRPVQAVATALGATIYVTTLPFSLMGGNADEAGKNLVVIPFRATFLRCLGCTNKHVRDYE